MSMAPQVLHALDELACSFPGHRIHHQPDGQGGAWVVVDDLALGPAFSPDTSWIGFGISYLYPRADVYPHFVRPDLSRTDGRPLPAPPLNAGHKMPGFDQPATMLSRRSHRWDPTRDTAALKLLRVLHWFEQQDERTVAA